MAFGRLERSAASAPMSDINMTPLIDVMLVLVVILIITAPLLASALRLDLPKSDAARPDSAARAITVVIDARSQLHMNDQPISLQALKLKFDQTYQTAPDTEVLLRADRAVAYGKVVEVMTAAHQAGLTRLGFVADRSPTAEAAPAPP